MKDLKFILNYDGTATTLTNSPDGWDDVLVKYERSTKYWGLFRSYTIPLRFIKEAALILRNAFYTDGVNAIATLTIQKLNRAIMQYYTAYTATFDFASFKDFDNYVDVMVVDGGLSAYIKKNEDVVYDFVITDGKTLSIDLPPLDDKAFRAKNLIDMFTLIMDKVTEGRITSGQFGAASTLLTGLEDDIVLVSSQDYFSTTIIFKTSLSDFFKSVNAILSTSMYVTEVLGIETINIENFRDAFNDTLITTYSNVNNFELSVANELLFNTVKIGYPDQEYTSRIKANEPNTTTTLNVDGIKIKRELDLTSVYRCDIQGLIDIVENDETLQEGELFLVKVKIDGLLYILTDSGRLQKKYDLITEIILYNSELTPAHIITKHLDYLTSCLDMITTLSFIGSGGDNVNNQTKTPDEEDYKLEYFGTVGYSIYRALDNFQPYYIKIDVPMFVDLNSIVSLSSSGYVSFDYEGNTYKGYIMSAGIKLAQRGVIELKMLSHYDNDLSTLIR